MGLSNYFWDTEYPEFTLKDSFIISKKALLVYRIFALIAMIGIYSFVTRANDYIFLPLQYLTYWGVTSVGLYFAGVCFSYILYRDESKINLKNPYSFWRILCILNEFTFSIEVVIPPFFWIFLFPQDTDAHAGEAFYSTLSAHAFTAILIWLETLFNMNKFYKRHLVIVLGLAVIYSVVNCVFTLVTGEPVYPVITWKNVSTLVYGLMAFVVLCIGFYIGAALSNYKNDKNKPKYDSELSKEILDF